MKYLILNQLGTPTSPTPEAVGDYLREFLMDEKVIPLPRPFRDLLVKVGIVPRRKFSSAAKYAKIWNEQGSPLMFNTMQLATKMQAALGVEWKVIVGMRYSTPSLEQALSEIDAKSATGVYFLPLYPHYAEATVGSAVKKFNDELAKQKITLRVRENVKILSPFFEKKWFIKSLGEHIKSFMQEGDHLLLSYHGLPLSQELSEKISYRQQCLRTSDLLQNYLNLSETALSSAFQSRVGMAKWISPYTEQTAIALAKSGVKHLKVACPSFVADCLETCEEIGIELKETFLHNGGESFALIPSLNSQDEFAQGLIAHLNGD